MGAVVEMHKVDHISAGCVGDVGNRIFFIQARKESDLLTLLCEKFQVQQLAAGIRDFIEELHRKNPDLAPPVLDYTEAEMELWEPLEPLFRVGQMGVGYDEEKDLMILVAQALTSEEEQAAEASTARIWATRSQMVVMGAHGDEVASRGRPTCGNCLQPIDPEGHFCPKSNGHR
jgi:uncharacterized repeat protein (TIGR03847 family)